MRFRYYVQVANGRWSEVSYSFYISYGGKKIKSPCSILKQLNKEE